LPTRAFDRASARKPRNLTAVLLYTYLYAALSRARSESLLLGFAVRNELARSKFRYGVFFRCRPVLSTAVTKSRGIVTRGLFVRIVLIARAPSSARLARYRPFRAVCATIARQLHNNYTPSLLFQSFVLQ